MQMTSEQKIAALRKWPKLLALSFIGYHDGRPKVTWQEFCDAQDQYEEVICGMRSQLSEASSSVSSASGSVS